MILRQESRTNFRLLSVLRNEGERRCWGNMAENGYSATSVLRQEEDEAQWKEQVICIR